MDLYKKKSLKFSGMSRGVRTAELDAARRSSRLQRFSLLRPIDDDDDGEDDAPKENVPSSSRIPTFGKQKSQIPSRAEMLKKWKEEKNFKKKLVELSKKPVFKAGGFAPKLQPSQASSNRFGQLSRIQGFQSSKNNSLIKTTISMKSKDIDSKSIPLKCQANSMKFQASKKVDVIKPPITRSQAIGSIPQTRNLKTDNITVRNPKPLTVTKPIAKENKSKDSCVSSNLKPKVMPSNPKPKVTPSNTKPSVTTASDAKASKKIPYSGITKPTTSLLPQRKQQNVPSKITKPAMKSSNPAPVKQTGTVSRKPVEKPKLGKEPPKNEVAKFGLGKGQLKKEVKDNSVSENENSGLPSQLDLNEAEKSFAPMGFVFRPPVELQVSWISDKNPFEIFESLKNENPRTSTPKQSEWKEYEELNSSLIQETPNTKKSTREKDSCSVPSSETKFIELLLDNSPSEIKLPVPNFLLDKPSEERVLEDLLPKENLDEIPPKVNHLEAQQSELLDTFHLKLDAPKTDSLGTEQFCIASSKITDSQIIAVEAEPSKNEPAGNETKTDTSVYLPNNSPIKIPHHCSLESEQKTAFEFCSPVKDLASNSIPELDLPLKNQLDPSLLKMGQSTNASSVTSSIISNLEEDEMGSLSDSVLLGQAVSNGTKSKRFTRSCRRSEKPALVKISESPEIRETPKSVGRVKALERTIAGEFTPRRSRRLARLSEFNSEENLFDIREPLYSSPGAESSQLTYDFDKLHLESKDTSEVFHRYSTRSGTVRDGKVSLLYTPPCQKKVTRKTIKGDLMSFSPLV